MTRVVSVGRSKGLFAIGALSSTLLTLCLAGCPGTLDPTQFPAPASGAGGSTGTAGMTTSMAGTTGTGGTGLPAGCDPEMMFTATAHNCTLAGACHDNMGSAANFKMAGATATDTSWMNNLVGVLPPGGGATPSMCMGKGMAYITKPTTAGGPAGGLILNKLTNAVPLCGAQMPNLGSKFTTAEIACTQAWANQLAAAAP